MYKDKNKQREANRKASQRRRDKGMTQGMTHEGMTVEDEPSNVIPKTFQENAMDILKEKTEPERTAQGNIRVSKPGDADYEPQCETIRAFVELSDIVEEFKR